MRATIRIAKEKLSFDFTTVNATESGRSIAMYLESGPFKSLKGVFRFTPMETQSCLIPVHFEFEFVNSLEAAALSGLVNPVCDSMIGSFRKQAKARYGASFSWNRGAAIKI